MSNLYQESVTDRTQADVDRVNELLAKVKLSNMTDSEQAEFLQGLKGAINTSDLLRIKNNIELLAEVLELDLTISAVPEIPTQEYFQEICTNVQAIRDCHFCYVSTPNAPAPPLNTYKKWNDIEQIIADAYYLLTDNFHYYAGEQLYSGDDFALLL